MAVVVRPRHVPARIDPLDQSLNADAILDRPVHPGNLATGPKMIGFGSPMIDVVGLTDQIKPHFDECDAVAVLGLFGGLAAPFRQIWLSQTAGRAMIVGANPVGFDRFECGSPPCWQVDAPERYTG